MSDDDLFSASIFGFFAGFYFFFDGFRRLRHKRLMENTPTSKIRSLAMGFCELNGDIVAAPGKILTAPFTHKECVYYRYEIEEYQTSGKRSRWVTIKKGESRDYFYLKDETAQVLVNPEDAVIDIPHDYQTKSKTGLDPPAEVKKFLSVCGINFEGVLGVNKTMRYTEHHLAPGNRVYVLGTACDNPFVAEGVSENSELDIIIKKGEVEKTFYISDRSEKECVFRHGTRALLQIIGGVILTIACLGYILAEFNIF